MKQSLDFLIHQYIQEYPQQIALLFQSQSSKLIKKLINALAIAEIVSIFYTSDIPTQKKIWSYLSHQQKVKFINALSHQRLPYLFTLVSEREFKQLMTELHPEQQQALKRLKKKKASLLFNTIHPAFSSVESKKIRTVLKDLSSTELSIYKYIYVQNHDQQLTGVILLRDLYRNDKDKKLSDIMQRRLSCLHIDEINLANLKHFFKFYSICPIVDQEQKFMGVIKSESIDKLIAEDHLFSMEENTFYITGIAQQATFAIIETLSDFFSEKEKSK